MNVPLAFAVFLVPIVIRFMLLHAQTASAKRKHGAVIFRADGMVLLCFVALLLASCIAIGGWRQGDGRTTIPIGMGFAALSLWLWPTTIILDQNGVSAKHIWRPTRSIPYTEIDFVSRMPNGEAILYGTKGGEIPVSEYHVAADELEHQLRKHGVKYYKGGL